jgi:hypothetical protein
VREVIFALLYMLGYFSELEVLTVKLYQKISRWAYLDMEIAEGIPFAMLEALILNHIDQSSKAQTIPKTEEVA